jgi:hypothetical protein
VEKLIITFSNNETLTLVMNDIIVPIIPIVKDDECFASMGKHSVLLPHIHNGLVPSLLDALCHCDFFYVNEVYDVVYSSKSIVTIKFA